MSEYIVKVEGQTPDAIYERQLEEIVRCRDCKHYEYAEVHRFDGARRREPTCARLTGCAVETKPDGFCAWGERSAE